MMSKSSFIMMVGLPGSTKSTYAAQLTKEGYVVHASDAIRAELGDETDQTRNGEVFEILTKRVRNDLMSGKNVVMDSTNLRRKHRMHLLRMLKGIQCNKKCIIMCVPFEECMTNNANRERQVPEHVMFKMLGNYQIPIYQEGWDKIELVYPKPEYEGYYGDPFDEIKSLKEYDQGNSHHRLSLGTHMERAGQRYLYDYGNFDDVCVATYMHDIGKPIMRSDNNGKGEVDGEIHYLQHHNAGCYLSLFYNMTDWPWINKQYVALLIEMHMRPHLEWKVSEEKLKKDTALFGEQIIEDIFKVHNCDLAAH